MGVDAAVSANRGAESLSVVPPCSRGRGGRALRPGLAWQPLQTPGLTRFEMAPHACSADDVRALAARYPRACTCARSPRPTRPPCMEALVESLDTLRRHLWFLPWVAEEQTLASALARCRRALPGSGNLLRTDLPYLAFAARQRPAGRLGGSASHGLGPAQDRGGLLDPVTGRKQGAATPARRCGRLSDLGAAYPGRTLRGVSDGRTQHRLTAPTAETLRLFVLEACTATPCVRRMGS